MTDFLLLVGVSKLGLSAGLAGLAWAVQRRFERPSVSHALWLLVLITLLAPAVVAIPVIGSSPAGLAGGWSAGAGGLAFPGAVAAEGTAPVPIVQYTKIGLMVAWVLGGVVVFVGSLLRVFRFHRFLRSGSEVAPVELQQLADGLARRLGLVRTPVLHTTRATFSPMVWWLGGPVRIVLPAAVLTGVDASALRWIVAHELAHVRRRDHWARWLEWLACVAFWWNPVAWWARRRLREAEELCCDALVLDALHAEPRAYAGALVTVVDVLSVPSTLRAPAFASGAVGNGRTRLIERRLKMIIDTARVSKTPRWQQVVLVLFVACVLPLGLAYCGPDAAQVADASRVDTLRLEHGGSGTVRINDHPVTPEDVKTVVRDLLGKAPADIVTVVVDDSMPWAYVDGVQKALGEAEVSGISFLRKGGRALTREVR